MTSNAGAINIAALVLAAGQSSRFGSDKRLHLLQGQSMLQRALSKPLALKLPTVLTLKPEDKHQLSDLLGIYQQHPLIHICYAEDAEQGMARSLSQGIDRLSQQFPHIDGAMVLLADMPWIELATIEQLIRRYQKEKIIISCYQNASGKIQRGHPVLFCQHWFKQLEGLTGNKGASSLIKSHEEAVIEMIVADEGVTLDLDTLTQEPR